MLNLLEAFTVDNYYFESWLTSLNDYNQKQIDSNITHSGKYTLGDIIYKKKYCSNEIESLEGTEHHCPHTCMLYDPLEMKTQDSNLIL